jgi:hypothetical protein
VPLRHELSWNERGRCEAIESQLFVHAFDNSDVCPTSQTKRDNAGFSAAAIFDRDTRGGGFDGVRRLPKA